MKQQIVLELDEEVKLEKGNIVEITVKGATHPYVCKVLSVGSQKKLSDEELRKAYLAVEKERQEMDKEWDAVSIEDWGK